MRCQAKHGCEGVLRVTHTYEAGEKGRTRRLVCQSCNLVHMSVELLGVITDQWPSAGRAAKEIKKRPPSLP